jgi:hypothetical protein
MGEIIDTRAKKLGALWLAAGGKVPAAKET